SLLFVCGAFFGVRNAVLKNRYDAACALLEDGSYSEAIGAFDMISFYKDSAEKAEAAEQMLAEEIRLAELEVRYLEAQESLNAGDYLKAAEIFGELDSYKNSSDMQREAYYLHAKALYADGDCDGALSQLGAIKDYKDASDLMDGIKKQQSYLEAERSLAEGDDFKAIELFKALGDYADAKTRVAQIQKKIYQDAERLLAEEDYFNAFSAFIGLGDYADCKSRAEEIQENCYQKACAVYRNYASYEYPEAFWIFEKLDGYKDSANYAHLLKERMYEHVSQVLKYFSDFEKAFKYLEVLGDYKECARIEANLPEQIHKAAIRYFNLNDYEMVIKCFMLIPDYNGGMEIRLEANYQYALRLVRMLDNCAAWEAYNLFAELGNYKDSREYVAQISVLEEKYQQGIKLYEDGAYSDAIEILKELKDYRSSPQYILESALKFATEFLEQKDYEKAYDYAKIADGLEGIDERIQELLDDILYEWGAKLYADGKLSEAVEKLTGFDAGRKSTTLRIQLMRTPEYWKLPDISSIYFGEYIVYVADGIEHISPISWDVYRRDGNKLWLISDKVIDCRYFGGDSWENCELRAWLNGEFYNTWFSEEEKKYITEMDRDGGIVDKISLISSNEFTSAVDSIPTFTMYARMHGCPIGSVSWSSEVSNWYLLEGYGELDSAQWWGGRRDPNGIRPIICITVE
ncbi:MAG: hypothetical protein IKM09_03375, partial [Clostridia bacterium]|nr:hypothetical protein [Clostridia bacterium]